VTRMRNARSRARFLPPESCSWTLTPPPCGTGAGSPGRHAPRRTRLSCGLAGTIPPRPLRSPSTRRPPHSRRWCRCARTAPRRRCHG
jgi:hypothetical protein